MYSPLALNLAEISTNPDSLTWEAHDSIGRKGTRIHRLFQSEKLGQQVALVHCAPGSYAQSHFHEGHESFYVLEGCFEDESGRYGKGQLVVYPPGSQHSWSCPEGALIYVVWGGPVSARNKN
ncbi:MAG TPA: cupin domain-containing protein [Gallionella sp.]|jgi:anti-sigma factor ChrR (cupin superfamily)|uniref:ChrR-like cupin domain-containing protein n=1 Tax=mine drainage metagenome TaxID=410659 RepID=E6QVJ3_9ZZZZ|nr:cupin domain-containing protein [Gallionella sp.]